MKLYKKIALSFLIIILVSLVIVGLVYGFMIKKDFNNYLIQEQVENHNKLVEEINKTYEENNFNLSPKDLNYYSRLGNVHISIRDLNNRTLTESFSRPQGGAHDHRGHMSKRKNNFKNRESYVEKSYPLFQGEVHIANIVLGFIDNSHFTQNAQIFLDTLDKSLVLSGFLASIVGFMVSLFLSHSISQPIVSLTKRASDMTRGKLIAQEPINPKTQEIMELSQSIDELGLELQRQEKIRKKYAQDISHELRTPISTIQSHLEAIIDGIWQANEKHLNILLTEVHRLSALVDDLNKSFSNEVYELPLDLENFNLSEEIKKIAITYEPVLKKAGHDLKYDIEENIFTTMDRYKLNQVLYNILSNSKEHMGRKGLVLLNLSKEKDDAIIKVEDNGVGIKSKDLPRVLDRFYKADPSRSKKTSGIGLSISKTFIEEHGGSLDIESEFNQGTKVLIKLPLEKASK